MNSVFNEVPSFHCRIRERKESVTVLLCGTSGCGKSTLSALLVLLLPTNHILLRIYNNGFCPVHFLLVFRRGILHVVVCIFDKRVGFLCVLTIQSVLHG